MIARAESFDAAVIGAGVVGAAAALALAEAGLDVSLADARMPLGVMPADGDPYDLRVYALSQGSRRLLDSLHVWRELPAARIANYRRMQVWDENGSGQIEFDATLIGEEVLGFIVEQQALLAALMQQIDRHSRIVVRNAAATGSVAGQRDVQIQFDDDSAAQVRLVVAADGAGSPLRERAGIKSDRESYGQSALIAHVRTELAHDDVARQRFLSSGPLALLPLADGRVSIVWSCENHEAARLCALDTATFLDELTAASGGCLGRCLESTGRASFPLARWQASEFTGDRLLLLGDAAHGVHPLAGQGLNLGLQDVATFRDLVIADRSRDSARFDAGGAALLLRHARARQADNALAGHAFGALNRLFAARSPLIALARGVGMNLVDRALPIKRLLAEHASGL